MWTRFTDMYSRGERKLEWEHIYIELPELQAIEYFKQMFNRDPNNITCSCCGEDYAIYDYSSEDVPSSVELGALIVKVPKDYKMTNIPQTIIEQSKEISKIEVYETGGVRLIKLD